MYQMSNIVKGHINVASMKYPRIMHACTIFQDPVHNGRPIAIVAGSEGGSESYTAEIWDFTVEGTSWVASKIILNLICINFFKNG